MIYSLIAGMILALQFSATKLYQIRRGVGMKISLTYMSIGGLCTALIFLVINGFKVELTGFSLLMGLAGNIFSTTYTLLGFKLMSMGAVAVYTLFLMLGTMIIPYFYGVLLLGEEMRALQLVGVAIITVALLIQCMDNGGGAKKEKKNMALFAFLCVAVFLCNGLVGIFTKAHQINTRYPVVDTFSYVIIGNLIFSSFSAIPLLVMKLRKTSGDATEEKAAGDSGLLKNLWIIVAYAIMNGASYFCQLLAAETAPASALFPVLTGSSVVLTAVAAWGFFKEKPSKIFMWALLIAAVGTVLFAF